MRHIIVTLGIASKDSDKTEEMPIIIPSQTLKVDKSSLKRKASQSFETEKKNDRHTWQCKQVACITCKVMKCSIELLIDYIFIIG